MRAWICLVALAAAAVAEPMRDVVARYATDREDIERYYDMNLSPERYDRLEAFEQAQRERLAAIDFDALDRAGRIDYLLLRARIDFELKQIARHRKKAEELRRVLPFAAPILELEQGRRAVKPITAREAAGKVGAIHALVRETREEAKLTGVAARRAARATRELVRHFASWFRNHAEYDPLFAWWVKGPYEKAHKALDDLAKRFATKGGAADGLVGEPIGRAAIEDRLRLEMLPYPPEKLLAIADEHYAYCVAEMKKASRAMGLKDDWKKALEKVKTQHVEPGKQAELVAAIGRAAVAFCDEHELVTIPKLCRETWHTQMISRAGQRNFPFASYGGQKMNVAFATAGMTHAEKTMAMRGNNRHFTRLVTPHELIPGHHLQGFWGQRVNRHRSLFRTSFYVEGWAVYGEMLFYEMGFAKTPEDRIGNLFWRMHRCARIVVSLKFHLGQMTPEAMVDYLVEKIGHEPENARAEVRRYVGGTYGPLYQAGYLVGALQLWKLREEALGEKKMTERAFHDAILDQNTIPIEMVRAAVLELELKRDSDNTWDFHSSSDESE